MPVANRAGHINPAGAPANLVAMYRPVFCAAFIRAEPPGLKAAIRGGLRIADRHVLPGFPLYVVGAGGVPVAKGLHSGLGRANFIGDLRKALTGLPQLYDLLPLSVVHRNTSVVVVYTFLFGHMQRQCGHPKPKRVKRAKQVRALFVALSLISSIARMWTVVNAQLPPESSMQQAILNLVVAFRFFA